MLESIFKVKMTKTVYLNEKIKMKHLVSIFLIGFDNIKNLEDLNSDTDNKTNKSEKSYC